MKKLLLFSVLVFTTLSSIAALANPLPQDQDNRQAVAPSQKGTDRIDNLAYKVDPDGTVTLLGQVSRPTLKSDAENVVKRIEGVEKVVNNIEVLPTSMGDDRIRRATYQAIYGSTSLSQYQLRAVPPIHIIVNNGHVTLEGVVARQMDKQVAGMQANQVQGVFSVTNNLQVEEQDNKEDAKK